MSEIQSAVSDSSVNTELRTTNFKAPVRFYGDVYAVASSGFPQRAEATVDVTGASTTAADLIPEGSLVLGVTIRVLAAITGPTTFRVGDAYNNYEWGISVSGAANTGTTIADFQTTYPNPKYYLTATDVWLTPNAINFSAGTVLVRVYYISLAAPAPGV